MGYTDFSTESRRIVKWSKFGFYFIPSIWPKTSFSTGPKIRDFDTHSEKVIQSLGLDFYHKQSFMHLLRLILMKLTEALLVIWD